MNVCMIEIAAICGIVIFAIIVSTSSYFQDADASSIFDLFKNFFSKKSNNGPHTLQNNSASNSNTPLPTTNTVSSSSSSGKECDQTLWKHVYNPSRLQVVAPCKSVLGIIESKRVERDGDYHIRVKLDSQFSNLINSANIKNQFGDLVVEPICVNRVTQTDAISACQNFHQNISIPPTGAHVNITGSYVLDKEHGMWAEIHPVTSITKTP
jgi:hypothetical protein